jgi:hypothetical protein
MGQVWHRTGVDRGGASKIFQADPATMLRKTGPFSTRELMMVSHKSTEITDFYTQLSMVVPMAKTTNQRCVPAVPCLTATQPGSGAGIWLDGGAGVIDPWLLGHCATDLPQICHRFAFLG